LTSITLTPSPNPVAGASGIAVDSTGTFLYVANNLGAATDGTITAFRIDQTTGNLTALAGSPFTLGLGNRFPQGLAATGSVLFVVLGVNNAVEVMTITSGTGAVAPSALFGLPFAGTPAPLDIKLDSASHLYVDDFVGGSIASFTITNATTGALSLNNSLATGVNPEQIAVDPTSRFVFVANNTGGGAGSISAYTVAGGVLTAVTGSPFSANVGAGPVGVAEDPTGNFLYVSNGASTTIGAFTITQSGGTAGAPAAFLGNATAGTAPRFLLSSTTPAAPVTPSVPAASTWSLAILGVLLSASAALFYRKAHR
jgi:6-phosphogluconolactonase (cycloisomerase 2 family)